LGTLKGRDHSEGLGVDRERISEWISGKYGGKMWIRFIWLNTEALVNAVINLRFPQKFGNFWNSRVTISFSRWSSTLPCFK